MRFQKGFTLIELVMVIVILGVLSAVALPKFIDTTSDARAAAVKGVAGGLASSSAVNYAASIAKGQINGAAIATATAMTGVQDTSGGCTEAVATSLIDGTTFHATNAGAYNVSGGSLTNVGDTTVCTVQSNDDNSQTATFTLSGAK